MVNWLRGLLGRVYARPGDLWNAIITVVLDVYTALSDEDGNIITFINNMSSNLWRLALTLDNFTSNAYPRFQQFVEGGFASLRQRIDNDQAALQQLINANQNANQHQFQVVDQTISDGLSSLIKWIIQHVLSPLTGEIGKALAWIAKEGAYVYDLLTNLEKLADLIIAFLWSGWLVLARKYAKQVVMLIFAQWKNWLPALLPIIEDILTSVF